MPTNGHEVINPTAKTEGTYYYRAQSPAPRKNNGILNRALLGATLVTGAAAVGVYTVFGRKKNSEPHTAAIIDRD